MLLAESLLGTNAASAANYIEDVFSTYLYTGNSSTQTITNGIDLSTKGGLVWMKSRTFALDHQLYDTARGTGKLLYSNLTNAEATVGTGLTAFTTSGFTIGSSSGINDSSSTYASWTFRKQPKFFDVVTYTGNGTNRTIAHNLGSVPGCIIVKCTSDVTDWAVYHRSLTSATNALQLNTTGAQLSNAAYWNSTAPTSTVFSVGTDNDTNGNLRTYVAYLFAHDAGGFGATGSDNVISCGSYTGNGSATGPTISLGYEPQWVLIKQATNAGTRWTITDNMRGFPVTSSGQQILQPNLNNAEIGVMYIQPTSTGFKVVDTDNDVNFNGATYIYIAIRRGPMKTPTLGTSVLRFDSIVGNNIWTEISTNGRLGNSVNGLDAVFTKSRAAADNWTLTPRLTGFSSTTAVSASLSPNLTNAESVKTGGVRGGAAASSTNLQAAAIATGSAISYSLGRAPGFFDVVCYTGTGVSGVTVNHNLGTSPQLVITKVRNFTGEDWVVHYNSGSSIVGGYLNNTTAFANSSTAPSTDIRNLTSTTYTLNTSNRRVNGVYNYVAYLFATVAGVSKVFSYTGNGSSQTINCGFTGGARFVLIKRTDSTGNWTVFDSARGIVAGNDPALYLNSTAAEVTTIDAVDTDSSGFIVNQDATLNLNVNSASYIGLAIA